MSHISPDKNRFAQKFGLWLAIVSMIMMFAGFTSAYIVRKADITDWNVIALPSLFFVSTGAILLSSLTLWMASRAFKASQYSRYRSLIGLTALLGTAFIVIQVFAWRELYLRGLLLNEDTAAAFLYVLTGVHALHVLAGVVILYLSWTGAGRRIRESVLKNGEKAPASSKHRVYMTVTFWHFVDILWIYLFVFLLLYR